MDRLLIQRYYLLSAQQNGSWPAKMKYYINLILHIALGSMLHYSLQITMDEQSPLQKPGAAGCLFTMTSGFILETREAVPGQISNWPDSWGIWCQTQFGLAEMTGCWKKGGSQPRCMTWGSYLTSSSLDFLICKIGVWYQSCRFVRFIKNIVYKKHLGHAQSRVGDSH